MPELIPIMAVTYLATGWYNVDPQYKKYAGKEIAAINQLARRQNLISNFGGSLGNGLTRKDLEKQRAAQRVELFGTDELWSDYRKQFAPMLSEACLLYTSPSPRDRQKSRMPSSA